ncbi:MAG: hypothetical protein Q8P41_30625 [Pseudomonadota bacterium]|nr:hypothetical protein [Pseudomonadota bacterium]
MATLLFLILVPAMAACASDPCNALCLNVALGLDECLPGWGLTWEEVGAESRVDWRVQCQNDWEEVRSGLEARELPAAEDQCTDAAGDLDALQTAEDAGCAELRALYLD